jgi:hypothetical protein
MIVKPMVGTNQKIATTASTISRTARDGRRRKARRWVLEAADATAVGTALIRESS